MECEIPERLLPKTRNKIASLNKSQEDAMIPASKHWTVTETERLTEALKKYGSSDLEKVSEFVGTRTASEVRHALNQKKTFIRKYQQEGEDESQAPNIHHWCEVVRKSVDSYSRAKDFSTVLSEIMQALSNTHSNKNEEVDFGQIYTYLHSILEGAIPPIPGPAESLVIINIVKDLSQIFKLNPFEEERELLQTLHKRPTCSVPQELKVVAFAGKNVRKEDKRKKKWRHLKGAQKEDACQNSSYPISQESITSSANQTHEQPQNYTALATNDSNIISIPSTSTEELPQQRVATKPSTSNLEGTSVPEKYPVQNLLQHRYKMVVYSTNPLQIPVEFITKSREFIKNTHV